MLSFNSININKIRVFGFALLIMTNSKIPGNRLECCQLREFQRWLTDNSTQLDEQSRRSAVCFTPQYQTNAPLVDIKPLECIDNSDDVNNNSFLPYNEIISKEIFPKDDSTNIKSILRMEYV